MMKLVHNLFKIFHVIEKPLGYDVENLSLWGNIYHIVKLCTKMFVLISFVPGFPGINYKKGKCSNVTSNAIFILKF